MCFFLTFLFVPGGNERFGSLRRSPQENATFDTRSGWCRKVKETWNPSLQDLASNRFICHFSPNRLSFSREGLLIERSKSNAASKCYHFCKTFFQFSKNSIFCWYFSNCLHFPQWPKSQIIENDICNSLTVKGGCIRDHNGLLVYFFILLVFCVFFSSDFFSFFFVFFVFLFCHRAIALNSTVFVWYLGCPSSSSGIHFLYPVSQHFSSILFIHLHVPAAMMSVCQQK